MRSNPQANARPSRRSLWLVMVYALAVAALVGVWQTPQRINHDCALYLQEAQMLLDGAVPYCDFLDINPPLNIYLNVLPVWLGRELNVSPIVVFQTLVLALLFVSVLELHSLLRKRRMGLRPAEQTFVLLAWMALFFLVDWRGDVGQREHLFVLLYVPYLFLRILRHRGGSLAAWFALLLGIQAGLGTSLKPHFLLAAVAVELVLLLASRRWRTLAQPECFALAGVVAAYLAHWLFVPTAMREAFFGRWVPLICHGYRAYDASYREIVASILASPFSAAGLLAMSAAALLLCTRRRGRLRLHLLALTTLALAGLAVVLFQHKGWSYHRIPFDTAALLCLTMLGLVAAKRAKVSNLEPRSPATIGRTTAIRGFLLCAFGILLAVWFLGRSDSARPEPPQYLALRQIVAQRSSPGDRVLVIATSARPAFPMLVQLDRRPGSRYLCSFPLAWVYAGVAPSGDRPVYRRGEEAPVEERRFLNELRDDVLRLQPQLIIVHNTPGWLGLPQGFNTSDYLVYSGWTKQALASYREISSPEGWKVFERR